MLRPTTEALPPAVAAAGPLLLRLAAVPAAARLPETLKPLLLPRLMKLPAGLPPAPLLVLLLVRR